MDSGWVKHQYKEVEKKVCELYSQTNSTYQNTKSTIDKEVKPYYETVQQQRHEAYVLYEGIMDPKCRKTRDLIVFVPTLSIGMLTLFFVRRPRPILRNCVFTYTLLSLA
jgi:hypothetical protein